MDQPSEAPVFETRGLHHAAFVARSRDVLGSGVEDCACFPGRPTLGCGWLRAGVFGGAARRKGRAGARDLARSGPPGRLFLASKWRLKPGSTGA